MVWDPIMSVGRTPMVTEDLISNPYSLGAGQEITSLSTPQISKESGTTASSLNGNLSNLTNINNDFNTVYYSVIFNSGSTVSSVYNIVFDMQKSFYVDSVEFAYNSIRGVVGAGAVATNTFSVQGSDDGNTWSTFYTNTITYTGPLAGSATQNVQGVVNNRKFRFLRLRMQFETGPDIIALTTELYRLRFVSNFLQR